ncbi:MAG: CopG family transcriptional regulator [Deltaproteobacteria bacterium]|nr:CopG family transcriptional regulator [Deltaproteobacteria bacterium]
MMVKTQVYLPAAELRALHRAAKRSGKSVAQLVREAVRRSCLPPGRMARWGCGTARFAGHRSTTMRTTTTRDSLG